MIEQMKLPALSGPLLKVLHEVKPLFIEFALVGGSNLAYRFEHRTSVDIDFFAGHYVPLEKMEYIYNNLIKTHGEDAKIKPINENKKHNLKYSQFSYITNKYGTSVKIDVFQNHHYMKETKQINGINFLSLTDIGLLKIESMISRGMNKDAYDLDFITDPKGGNIDIRELWDLYKEKRKVVEKLAKKTVFDNYKIKDPLKHPEQLKKLRRHDYFLTIKWDKEEKALERWGDKVDKLLNYIKQTERNSNDLSISL